MCSLRYIAAAMSCVIMAACGSGGSGGGVSLGSGQDADPVVMDFPIAYVQRSLLLDSNGDLQTTRVRDAVTFQPGAALIVRDRASPSAAETRLTDGVFPDDADGNPPLFDVKDLNVSWDGARMVFAMRAPFDPNLEDDEQQRRRSEREGEAAAAAALRFWTHGGTVPRRGALTTRCRSELPRGRGADAKGGARPVWPTSSRSERSCRSWSRRRVSPTTTVTTSAVSASSSREQRRPTRASSRPRSAR